MEDLKSKDFRIIAIIPLEGCSSKYRKNLKIGEKYLFYNNYEIELSKTLDKVKSCKKKKGVEPVAENLYQLKNGIKLNISAIVGKNGNGKSALFELLYYFIYIFSINKKLNDEYVITSVLSDLKKWAVKIEKDYFHYKNNVDKNPDEELTDLDILSFKMINRYEIKDINYNQGKSKLYKHINQAIANKLDLANFNIETEEKFEKELAEKLAVSVIVERCNEFYEFKYYNSQFYFQTINSDKINKNRIKNIEWEELFYNVSLNYSHHSLNSETLGNWISKLFHKNDAYTTPVVINPMRNEGNYDINRELELSNERLLSNILFDIQQDRETLLLKKYRIKSFKYVLKNKGKYPTSYGNTQQNGIAGKLLYRHNIKVIKNYYAFLDSALDYLTKKIYKVRDNYGFLIEETTKLFTDKDDALLDFIYNDNTHITKKIRQTVNYIIYVTKNDNEKIWETDNPDDTIIQFNINKLKEWLIVCVGDVNKISHTELQDFALPSFFKIEYILEDDKKEEIYLNRLSSGEQQIIFNINSILYHLYNLQSVHKERNDNTKINDTEVDDKKSKRAIYNNVNIILDEIELYYHPEMQRLIVNDIVNALEKVKENGKEGIEAINIVFLTHSPFILSDIPNSNILFLELDKNGESIPVEKKPLTFGANINDLLASSFFMDGGFMGEFAKKQINEIINFLDFCNYNSKLLDLLDNSGFPKEENIELYKKYNNKRKVALKLLIGHIDAPLDNIESVLKTLRIDKSKYRSKIEIVGEPAIKNSLLDYYNEIFFKSVEDIDNEIERLQKLKTERN